MPAQLAACAAGLRGGRTARAICASPSRPWWPGSNCFGRLAGGLCPFSLPFANRCWDSRVLSQLSDSVQRFYARVHEASLRRWVDRSGTGSRTLRRAGTPTSSRNVGFREKASERAGQVCTDSALVPFCSRRGQSSGLRALLAQRSVRRSWHTKMTTGGYDAERRPAHLPIKPSPSSH